MNRNSTFNHLLIKDQIYTLHHIKKDEDVCGRLCGTCVNSTRFCMQEAGSCTVVFHNTRRQGTRKRSTKCVSNKIYLKVTTTLTKRAEAVDAEGASYAVEANKFPFMGIEELEDLIMVYDEELKNCFTDTDAMLCFRKFVEVADDKRKECEEDLIRYRNEGSYWGEVGNGDIDPDEGY